MRYLTVITVLGSLLMIGATGAWAGPFSTDVTITGEIEFDTVSSFADLATSTGQFGLVIGGAPTDSLYNSNFVTIPNPVLGTFTDLNDGLGIMGLALGQYTPPAAGTAGFGDSEFMAGIDLEMTLANSSATDTYEVTLLLSFTNSAYAVGFDAYLASEFTLDDDVGEIFFTDLLSDTFFGNEIGGVLTGGFGGFVTETGLPTFTLTLAPGDTAGVFGAWTMEGGAYDQTSSVYEGLFGMNLTIVDVKNLTIPEPGTALLLVPGLAGLVLLRRRRR